MKITINILAALVAILASTAMAAEAPATSPLPQHQVTFRDPVTGRIREPTEAELAELTRAIEREDAIQPRSIAPRAGTDTSLQWRTVTLPNGHQGRIAELPEQMHSWLVAEQDADGKYRVDHAAPASAATQEVAP